MKEGEYKFTISDSYGDGKTVDGNYTVTSYQGALIALGGEFEEESESTPFSIPFIRNPKPTDLPTLEPILPTN